MFRCPSKLRCLVFAVIIVGLCAPLLADKAADAKIDSLLKSLGRSSSRKNARKQLNAIGAQAVPRLIHHVKGSSLAMRALALSGLQTCWSPDAVDVVTGALADRNKTVRNVAHTVLQRNLSRAELGAVMSKLVGNRSVVIAGPALQSADLAAPNVSRMARALTRSGMWKYLDRDLPRYHSASLTPGTLAMLARAATAEKTTALCGLIHQQDNSPQTRSKIAKRLRLGAPSLRAMAAEYMRWHGGRDELDALKRALKVEPDAYCQAALLEAVEAIGRREKMFKDGPDIPTPKWPDEPARAYRAAIDLLKKHPTKSARASVLKLLASAEPFEPLYDHNAQIGGGSPGRDSARLKLLSLAAGYPTLRQSLAYRREPSSQPTTSQPSAMKLTGPVRDYFDPKRKSFGFVASRRERSFTTMIHIGDDVAWYKPQSTVVAIGAGRVKFASVGVPSWGGLVVIEHTGDKSGPFCSLYGHLGPLVCVRPGQQVRRGQKIAAVGRSFAWSNGGYHAHLHFGVRKGPFSRVVFNGYLPPHTFKNGAAGWIEPQKFIRARLK
jgi:murein DD-endopeptidase MepM/ murein hydrolase activator NlpD